MPSYDDGDTSHFPLRLISGSETPGMTSPLSFFGEQAGRSREKIRIGSVFFIETGTIGKIQFRYIIV
jgi:hypothetical protein